jgi:DNA-binding NtrC family response regulator
MAPPRVSAFKPDQLWQQAREPMFWLDPALRVTWVNRAWEGLTGRTAEAVLGLCCASPGPTRDEAIAQLAASFIPPPEAIAGQPTGSLASILAGEGARLWRRIEFWPFRDETGALLGLLGQVREPESTPSVPDSQVHQLRIRLLQARHRLQQSFGVESLIGTGPAHRRVLEQVRLAAITSAPVLLVGEPGTGKRLVASTIHHLGAGRDRPLVPFDCQALPADLLERELFFPGRTAKAQDATAPPHQEPPLPRLSLPDGTSLLIGDILALPRDLQSRLVESLDGRVRLLATTAGDPEAAMKEGQLRPDLYYAMSVLVIRLDPLRRRQDDIPLLAEHFLERADLRVGSHSSGFTTAAIAAIRSYDWPGNLTELARVIEVAHAQARSRSSAENQNGLLLIDSDDLPASIRGHLGGAYLPPHPPQPIKALDELLTEIERRLIETALRKARQNKSRAAELLGISRPRLYRRIKELNLPDDSEPGEGAASAGVAPPTAS